MAEQRIPTVDLAGCFALIDRPKMQPAEAVRLSGNHRRLRHARGYKCNEQAGIVIIPMSPP
jgi:hypothetical protein